MSTDSFQGQRILLTVACGKVRYAKQAMALAMSVRLHGARTPLVLISDCADAETERWFDAVVPPVPGIEPYLQKLVGLQTTGAAAALFLDSDSLALRNLDPLFDQLEGTGFAAMGDWISDGYYWGETSQNLRKLNVDRIARLNGGLLYYERTEAGLKVIDESLRVSRDYDASGLDRLAGKIHDEGCVSPAMSTTGLGRLIPDTNGLSLTPWTCFNVRLDVLRGEFSAINGYRGTVQAVRPAVYHSAMAGWDLVYWREVRRLLKATERGRELRLQSGRPMPFARKVSRKMGEFAATVYKKLFLRDF